MIPIDYYREATDFCIWFYQTRRGKINTKNPDIPTAIEVYINLFQHMNEEEKSKLKDEVNILIKENNCLERYKSRWKAIGESVNELFDNFREDDSIPLSANEKEAVIYECDPLLLTYNAFQPEDTEFNNFVKTYYDLSKRNERNNSISEVINYKEELLINVIKDYIHIHSDPLNTLIRFNYIAPREKSIVNLLKLYLDNFYLKENNNIKYEALFNRIFKKDLSFSRVKEPQRPSGYDPNAI